MISNKIIRLTTRSLRHAIADVDQVKNVKAVNIDLTDHNGESRQARRQRERLEKKGRQRMTKQHFYYLVYHRIKSLGYGLTKKDFVKWVNMLGVRFGDPEYFRTSDCVNDLADEFIRESST